MVALAIVVVALLTTGVTANWIRTRADALTPVALPGPISTPLPTVTPQGYLKPEISGGFMVNTLGDKLPRPPNPPWFREDTFDPVTYRGVGVWMTVHDNYDGKGGSWGNVIGFGMFQPEQKYTSLRNAAALVGGRMINQLYKDPKLAPIEGSVKHRELTVDGHKAHEIVARVPVKQAKVKETFSILAILVVDRGDKTLAVTYGDIAGSTPQYLAYWRQNAQKMQIAR